MAFDDWAMIGSSQTKGSRPFIPPRQAKGDIAMNRSTLLLGLAGLLILGAVLGLHRVHDMTFGFVAMPPTDDDLRQWLAEQPGVESVEIWRERKPQEMLVTFSSSNKPGDSETKVIRSERQLVRIRYRVHMWQKGSPDFTLQWERLGYKGFRGPDGTVGGGPNSSETTTYTDWGWW
jgi:hypothetical protein